MTSSASRLLTAAAVLFAAAAFPGVAPVFGAAAPAPGQGAPARLTERATAAIAERWGVTPGAIVLSWGRVPEGLGPFEVEAPIRLSGRGQDGRFAVVLLPGRGRAITLVARAGHRDSIAVAVRSLENGHRLTAADVRHEARVTWGPPAADAEERPGVDWIVRRALAAGEPLQRPGVAPPELVAAGEPVKLVWSRGTVSIALDGRALHGASRGETVSARVPGRTERVRGIVIAPGTAELASEVNR